MTKIYDFQNIGNSNFCQKNNINLDWENEVLTEFKTYQHILNNDVSLPLDYIAYPWAFLIDLYQNKFRNIFSSFYYFLKEIDLIDQLPKKRFITTVQSYHFNKFMDVFKKIGIKYIFSPHINKKDFLKIFYKYDIIVYPYIIYPSIQLDNNNKNPLGKHILYNFIGNTKYNSDKVTQVRTNIVEMKHLPNTIIKGINQWHFNQVIYGKQLKLIKYDQSIDIFKEKLDREKIYKKTMETSLFCICPLGIGPNSIRLWESFTYNTIPISISDDLWLPFYLDVNWDNLMINIKESNYQDIVKVKDINSDKINLYQNQGLIFYQNFLQESKFGNIIEKAFQNFNEFILLIPWYNITDERRFLEIHNCLGCNIKNKFIKQIVFFYETDNVNNIDYNKYSHPKIKIIPILTNLKRDIKFNLMAKYANEQFINQTCIISNNDIYFDETLSNIYQLDFYKNKYLIALTRKNYGKYLDSNNRVWKPHPSSQDSWIFRTPIHLMKEDVNLGWIQCDNIIAENYYSLGYNVVNPHFSINGWHLHMYNNTNHLLKNYNYNYKHKMRKVPLETIETIIENSKKLTQINIQIELPEFKKPEFKKPSRNNKINISKLSEIKKKWKQNNLEV